MRVTSIRTLNGKCNQKANQSSNVHIRACLLKVSLSKPMIATNGNAFPFLNCVAPGAHDGLLVALNFRFIKFSGALIYATLISIPTPNSRYTTFLTPMKDTSGEIHSSFDPLRTFRERTTTKVSISDHTVSLCLCCLTNFCFLRTSR